MIQFRTQKASDEKGLARTLVVVVRKNGKKHEALGATKEVSEMISSCLEDGLTHKDLKSGVFLRRAAHTLDKNILLIGLDEKYKTLEDVRRAAAQMVKSLKSNKVTGASIYFEGYLKGFKNVSDATAAFVEGALLADYKFDDFKSKKKSEDGKEDDGAKKELEHLGLVIGSKVNIAAMNTAVEYGETLAGCINLARQIGDTPGNLMTPEILAEKAASEAKGTKLKVTIWDKARIKKEKMGGLLGVSLGSAVDPRFIILEYHGGAKSKKPVCLVGKGLTFDSGGISIKPSSGMEEMKFDKCGGVNVICTMLAIARLKLKVNAIGLVPATENMPGPLANKPGDILVARNGKTIEVDNTDAEGRLILMDALAYASEQKPGAIFDAATLTGACVVALGNSYTGCFTRSEKVRKSVNEAAEKAGESVWQMPLNDHHLEDMKGTYADLNNISSFRGAGSSTAAAFLEQFVDKDIPWAHFDIAGTAWHTGNRINYCPKKGATGVMIRTFIELVKMYN